MNEVVVVDNDKSVIEIAFDDTPRPLFSPDEPASSIREEAPQRSYEGQLAVVTGASGALGAAISAELVARGARVCLIGRDMDALRATAERVSPSGSTALLRCDLASSDEVDSASDFIERIGRPVDLVVHAAGVFAATSIERGTVKDLDEHYLLDVRGPYQLTQRLLPGLVRAKGRVVFFSDGNHRNGATVEDRHRTITQAGARALAEALRDEAGPHGVRVLSVRADDDLGALGAGDATDQYLRRCAAAVLDAIAGDELDVTELRLRRGNRSRRYERR